MTVAAPDAKLDTCNEHHAAAWTSAATRLRAHALHAAADAAEET